MGETPSLYTLCMEIVKREILQGDDIIPHLYGLPLDMFDCLLTYLPPAALQKLQDNLSSTNKNHYESTSDCFIGGRKRRRLEDFNKAWRTLFKSRWPELDGQIQPFAWLAKPGLAKCELTSDWQQMYWETHIQNCLDAAAEKALLPSFDGCIGEIKIPGAIVKSIGYEGCINQSTRDHAKLSYHCQKFGHYARCLRLQNVLCVAETCHLLRNSKLESLVLRRIISKDHVNGLCKLLNQNKETLTSLKLIHCKLSSAFVNEICGSLHEKGMRGHKVQHFTINGSNFLETNLVSLPAGLVSFLSSGSLLSLKLCDNRLGRKSAEMVFKTLLDASSSLCILDFSENNITGWLCYFYHRPSNCPSSSQGLGKSLQSVRVLNLRGNNLQMDDANSLKYALIRMPYLEILDLSDNPIEDEGIKSFIPYLVDATKRHSFFSDLKFENCELSSNGVTELLETLSTFEKPLTSLSIAENDLGSQIAGPLGRFLGTSIKELNFEDIGLGSSGFVELQGGISKDLKLVYINISKNRGGVEAAKFLSKIILRAPELVEVNAGYNFLPAESMDLIFSALEDAKGKLERLDLSGNAHCYQPTHASLLADTQCNGKPIVILPLMPVSNAPYDDDP